MLWEAASLELPDLPAMHGKTKGPVASNQSQLLEAGIRLELEQEHPEWYVRLMQACFAYDAMSRPSAMQVMATLQEHLPQTRA